MHPIVTEQIARSRAQELYRQAELARRVPRPVPRRHALRLVAASGALRLARTLDRDERVVPAVVR
jgi:hypothetical protein